VERLRQERGVNRPVAALFQIIAGSITAAIMGA
jgi:hypothetical protein